MGVRKNTYVWFQAPFLGRSLTLKRDMNIQGRKDIRVRPDVNRKSLSNFENRPKNVRTTLPSPPQPRFIRSRGHDVEEVLQKGI